MMTATHNKVYLDQLPEFEKIVRDFINSLEPNFSEAYNEPKAEALECRRRDGFIPHSHNFGGFDRQWFTDLGLIWSTGYEVGSVTQELADKHQQEAAQTFIKYDASAEDKAILASLPEDKRNYHYLCELGHGELAERLDEYCIEWLSTCAVSFGYRVMYEGQDDSGQHNLMIYACTNLDEYRGAFAGTTEVEFEVNFRSEADLKDKLEQTRDKLQASL